MRKTYQVKACVEKTQQPPSKKYQHTQRSLFNHNYRSHNQTNSSSSPSDLPPKPRQPSLPSHRQSCITVQKLRGLVRRSPNILHRINQIHLVRWPSGLRRQLKVMPFVVHQYSRWSERAWVQIPLSSTLSFAFLPCPQAAVSSYSWTFTRLRLQTPCQQQ